MVRGGSSPLGRTGKAPRTWGFFVGVAVKLALSIVETVRGGKVVSVAAGAATKEISKKTVVAGSSAVTVAAGKPVTVGLKLNGAGKRLLKRVES
jgi:hypothetical protein